MIRIETFRTEGLGDSTYLVVYDGRAILVDPQRDIERFLADDVELRWVLETHLHNDYVSGGLAAAQLTGAELVMPAAAGPAFRHTPAFHQEDLVDGALTIRPLHTPGHTPEHTSYLIAWEGRPLAVFSGGSLLVGSAGRTDLLGRSRADSLARLQFRSLRALSRLDPHTGLYPTHGAGSFCTASVAGSHISTIGSELEHNPALAHADEDSFVAAQLADLQPYPAYYARMGPINLAGPPPMPETSPPRVEGTDIPAEAVVVDVRSPRRFASGHLPGAVNIPLSEQFGTWYGWLIPGDVVAYLVADNEGQVEEALVQLARIGVDELAGVVIMPDAAARIESKTGSAGSVPPDAQILDVRAPNERQAFAPPGSSHRYLPDLVEGPPPGIDPSRPVWVVCASGYRAAIAASLLRRHGLDAVPILGAGVEDL